jgi:hypothetical protein
MRPSACGAFQHSVNPRPRIAETIVSIHPYSVHFESRKYRPILSWAVGYTGSANADLGSVLASDWPTPAKPAMQKMRAEAKRVVAGARGSKGALSADVPLHRHSPATMAFLTVARRVVVNLARIRLVTGDLLHTNALHTR